MAMKDGCDPITSAKLALPLRAPERGPAHARAVRARGREDCRGELREGHIRVEWRMGGECGNAISVG